MSDDDNTQLSTQGQGTIVAADFDYGEDAKKGYENQTAADRKIPMIMLLQANSPEVAERKAQAGQYINSVTGRIYDHVDFVAGITDHCYVEWVPKDDGGGFRGRWPTTHKHVRDAIAANGGRSIGKLKLAPAKVELGNGKIKDEPRELVESFEVYAVLIDVDGEVDGWGVIPFSSAKIPAYKEWNTAISSFQMQVPDPQTGKMRKRDVPLFAHRMRMTSVYDTSNPKGNFYKPVIEPLIKDKGPKGEHIMASLIGKSSNAYQQAKKLNEQVLAGHAKAAYETTKASDGAAGPEDAAPF